MKTVKNIFISLLLIFVIFNTSCSTTLRSWSGFSDEQGNILPTDFKFDISDGYYVPHLNFQMGAMSGFIYYHDGTSFVQYNEKTGQRSYLCPRANCSHKDTNCSFYSSMTDRSLYAKDNKLFFKRAFDDGDKLVVYDITSGKQTVLHTVHKTEGYAVASGTFFAPYFYYYEISTVDNDGVFNIGDVVLYRQNIETLKIEQVCSFDDHDPRFVIGEYDNSLVLSGSDGISLLSLSDSSEREILLERDDIENKQFLSTSCFIKDGYIWFFSYSDDSKNQTSTLWRYSIKDCELIRLADINGIIDAFNHSFTSDYIYFRTGGERNIGHFNSNSGANSGDLILSQPNFYRISYDGGEPQEILKEFPDYALTCNIIGEFCVDGNYIYARYNNYGPDLKDEYTMEDFSGSLSGLMRIDIRDESIIYVSGK